MLKKGTVLKVIALVLSCMFVLALAGCGQTGTQNKPTPAPTNAPQQGSGTQDGDGREMVGKMYNTGLPIVKESVKYYARGMQMNNRRPSNLDESELFVRILD